MSTAKNWTIASFTGPDTPLLAFVRREADRMVRDVGARKLALAMVVGPKAAERIAMLAIEESKHLPVIMGEHVARRLDEALERINAEAVKAAKAVGS